MGTRTIVVTQNISAPAEAVWELLADVTGWADWGPFDSAELESPGDQVAEGVGAVRRFRRGRYTTRERVTVFDPPHRLSYVLLSGIPIRDYAADVTLTSFGSSTTAIRWESHFRAKIPGTGRSIRNGLAQFIEELVGHIRTEAEARTRQA